MTHSPKSGERYGWDDFKGTRNEWAWWWLEFHYMHHAKAEDDIETEVFCVELRRTQFLYKRALAKIENLRAALLDLYETTKAEHGVHESEIEPWDSSSLGNAKGALADDQGEEK